jgi:hypothetical protein
LRVADADLADLVGDDPSLGGAIVRGLNIVDLGLKLTEQVGR